MQDNMQEYSARKARHHNTLALIIICMVIVSFISALCIYKYRHTFTVEKWNENKNDRLKIINDMLEKTALLGMPEQDVISLLGEEDNDEQTVFKIHRQQFPPDKTLLYYLGVDFMDEAWLVISLQDGHVTHYCIDYT